MSFFRKQPVISRPEIKLPVDCQGMATPVILEVGGMFSGTWATAHFTCRAINNGQVQNVYGRFIENRRLNQERVDQIAEFAAVAISGLCGSCILGPHNQIPDNISSLQPGLDKPTDQP